MRFIHAWAYRCSNSLMKQLNENHEKRRVYYYGFQILIGGLVKGTLLMLLSLLFRTIGPSLIILAVFASLRVLAGGYHMDTYGKCIVASLALFMAASVLAQYTYQFWSLESILAFVIITFIVGMTVVLKWAPKDTPNKPITDPKEIKKFKGLSVAFIIAWFTGALIFVYFGKDLFVIAATFGVILELFSVTPAGHHFFDRISGRVDEIHNKRKAATRLRS